MHIHWNKSASELFLYIQKLYYFTCKGGQPKPFFIFFSHTGIIGSFYLHTLHFSVLTFFLWSFGLLLFFAFLFSACQPCPAPVAFCLSSSAHQLWTSSGRQPRTLVAIQWAATTSLPARPDSCPGEGTLSWAGYFPSLRLFLSIHPLLVANCLYVVNNYLF